MKGERGRGKCGKIEWQPDGSGAPSQPCMARPGRQKRRASCIHARQDCRPACPRPPVPWQYSPLHPAAAERRRACAEARARRAMWRAVKSFSASRTRRSSRPFSTRRERKPLNTTDISAHSSFIMRVGIVSLCKAGPEPHIQPRGERMSRPLPPFRLMRPSLFVQAPVCRKCGGRRQSRASFKPAAAFQGGLVGQRSSDVSPMRQDGPTPATQPAPAPPASRNPRDRAAHRHPAAVPGRRSARPGRPGSRHRACPRPACGSARGAD